jgi:hypothetical protein
VPASTLATILQDAGVNVVHAARRGGGRRRCLRYDEVDHAVPEEEISDRRIALRAAAGEAELPHAVRQRRG